MTESRMVSCGPSPLIGGREAEFWRFHKFCFDLKDVFEILGGPRKEPDSHGDIRGMVYSLN